MKVQSGFEIFPSFTLFELYMVKLVGDQFHESGLWVGVERATDLGHGVAQAVTVNSNVCVQLQVCFVVIFIAYCMDVSGEMNKTQKNLRTQ